MTDIFEFCPTEQRPELRWDAINEQFSWIRDLKGCPQNPRYHAEGDVWIHTRMVCEAMTRLESWRRLSPDLRQDLFAAALLHDAAKPECTKVQNNGRITSRGHARRGALMARRLLWTYGAEPERRERICSLVRHHMVPLYLRDSEYRERQVLTISQSLRCDLLGILGIADADGRICDDPEDLRRRHAAFESICRDLECFESPHSFTSDAARFQYFHQLIDDPRAEAVEPKLEAVLMSGLPGSGKRRWVEENLAGYQVIDVEVLRKEMHVSWRDNQGAVISAARERARSLLAAHEPFVWIDMNLSRQLRDQLIKLFAEHGARIRLVYLEGTAEDVSHYLRQHSPQPDNDLALLLDHWEAPEPSEAHCLERIGSPLLVSL